MSIDLEETIAHIQFQKSHLERVRDTQIHKCEEVVQWYEQYEQVILSKQQAEERETHAKEELKTAKSALRNARKEMNLIFEQYLYGTIDLSTAQTRENDAFKRYNEAFRKWKQCRTHYHSVKNSLEEACTNLDIIQENMRQVQEQIGTLEHELRAYERSIENLYELLQKNM